MDYIRRKVTQISSGANGSAEAQEADMGDCRGRRRGTPVQEREMFVIAGRESNNIYIKNRIIMNHYNALRDSLF
jgi:hypothetical protein